MLKVQSKLSHHTSTMEEEEEATSLERGISDFTKSHKIYLETCLLNLKENFMEKSKIHILNVHFFPHLHLEKLIELHTIVQRKLEELNTDKKKISHIFEKLEKKFLIYAKVLVKIPPLIEFLQDRQKVNPDFKKELNRLTKDSKKNERNKDGDEILELMQKIPQHIMRYSSPYLEEIVKQAGKHSEADVEVEAKKAQEIMRNVLKHLNDFDDDYNNIVKVEDLEETYNVSLRAFGKIHLSLPSVDAYLKSKELQKYKLYILEEALVLLHQESNGNGNVFKRTSKIPNGDEEKKFNVEGLFKFKDAYEILGNQLEFTIDLKTFDKKMRVDHHKQVKIKLANEKDYLNVFNQLKERDARMQELKSVKPNSYHAKHIFKIFKNELTSDFKPDDNRKCFQCEKYLGGKILIGIECLTCGQIYHIDCFQNENKESFQNLDNFPKKSHGF